MFSRDRLPSGVRHVVPLPPGDRILASALLDDDRWLIATRTSLVLVDDTDAVRLRRPWCEVDRASFDPGSATSTVTWVDDAEPLTARLRDLKRLDIVRTIRERVESSVIVSRTIPVARGAGIRVAVRRDGTGALFSQVIADPGVDLDDPAVAAEVDEVEADIRSASGLPR